MGRLHLCTVGQLETPLSFYLCFKAKLLYQQKGKFNEIKNKMNFVLFTTKNILHSHLGPHQNTLGSESEDGAE